MPYIKGGYVLQPRIFDKSDASKMSPVTRELWFYLLRNVNHADNGKFKRGQRFFQFSEIQEDLHWYVGYRKMTYSKPQLTKALRRLNEGNMTATVKATRGIIITILNYDTYQDPKNYEGNDEGSTKDQRRNFGGNTINKNDKNKKNDKKENKTYLSDSVEYRLSELLYSLILKNNPNAKKPNINNWSDHIRLAMECDKRTSLELEAVIRWCQSDPFWLVNILSTKKLREKFDQLWLKMKQGGKNAKPEKFAEKKYGAGTDPAKIPWAQDRTEDMP